MLTFFKICNFSKNMLLLKYKIMKTLNKYCVYKNFRPHYITRAIGNTGDFHIYV